MITFAEFLEQKLRGVFDLKKAPVVPSKIPVTGFRNSGASKMSMVNTNLTRKPYKPIFRAGRS